MLYIVSSLLLFSLLLSDVSAFLRINSRHESLSSSSIVATAVQKLHYGHYGYNHFLRDPSERKSIMYRLIIGKQTTTQLWAKIDSKSSSGSSSDGPRKPKPPKDDVVQVNGRVVESLPNAMFRVEIEPSKQLVLATISGKIRKNFVRILVGDSVVVELSAYDLTKGRITFRNK